jgi:hypothetical protein
MASGQADDLAHRARHAPILLPGYELAMGASATANMRTLAGRGIASPGLTGRWPSGSAPDA